MFLLLLKPYIKKIEVCAMDKYNYFYVFVSNIKCGIYIGMETGEHDINIIDPGL